MVLDATPGGVSANSYVTVQEADAYFALKLGAQAWADLSLGSKQQALCHATIQIEMLDFKGVKLNQSQALAFPRFVAFPRHYQPGCSLDEQLYPSNTIPMDVKKACYEQALWLVKNNGDLTKRQHLQSQGVKSFSVDGFSENFGGAFGGASGEVLLSPDSRIYLRNWIFRVGEVVDFGRERLLRSHIINRWDPSDE
jgi:hypothetical protein